MKSAIMDQWDVNNDGKINKQELTMLLLQQGRMMSDEQDLPVDELPSTPEDLEQY